MSSRRLSARHSALSSVLRVSVAFGAVFVACRTERPNEVFYDGTSKGGAPSVAGAAGSAGTVATGGVGGMLDGTAGTGNTGNVAGAEENGGAGGGPGEEPDPNAAGAGGGATEEPEPEIDCGPAPVSQAAFTRRALREAATNCSLWHYCHFENAASKLERRVSRWVAEPSEPNLDAARAAWKAAMETWSVLELFQFGPLSSRSESAGKDLYWGQGLRESIYAWPSVARCRVEEQVAGQAFLTRGLNGVVISGRGLYALEYLLFYPGSDTACPPSSSAGQQWARLSAEELDERKRAYAAALGTDVLERARGLTRAFLPSGDDFQRAFIEAEGYPSEQEAMNVLAWALVYTERELKDWKLGVPAEYTASHPVTQPEAPYAGIGTENIRANLRGFRSMFQGCGPEGEGLGFDDWLVATGNEELANDIVAAWRVAQAAADAFPPLPSASREQVQALYAAVKGLTDLLKTDLFGTGSPLNLKLPGTVGDDTD